MSEPGKAVFLSYASQDMEAAKKICDALRAAGVEVWFDAEGGLEHGDEWDRKIRRQIKECVLFLPVISANTQAREEGYFRIEWDLAAERARGIASGVAFILPVVIDETKEPGALVPDRFRSVQWTRVPGGAITPEVQARFLKLWSHRTGALKHAPEAGSERLKPKPGRPRWFLPGLVGLAALVAALGAWFGLRPSAAPASPLPPSVAGAGPQAAAASPTARAVFPRDPDLRRAHELIFALDALVGDFALAEDIAKPVLTQRPNDPEVVTVAAEISQEYLSRGFDNSQTRRAQAQRLAERAVQLAPDSPWALAVLSRYLLFTNSQLARATELSRRAVALAPDQPRFHRTLYYLLFVTKSPAETDAYGERMAAQFPQDALVQYDIARRYKDANDIVRMERWFDRTLEVAPVAFAMIWKSWLALWVHGDLAGMKAWIDRVPERQQSNTRVANARYVHALYSGETGPALRALNELNDTWLTDFDFTGPRTLLLANLAAVDGRTDLARVLYEAALTTIATEEAAAPADLRTQRAKLWVLLGLNRREEARAIQRVLLQSLERPYRFGLNRATWTNPIISCLLLDFRGEAIALLGECGNLDENRLVLRNMFQLDPRLKPWRNDPEITALLGEPEAQKTEARGPSFVTATDGTQKTDVSSPPDQKSVAVLAFANLSDDKANEYFSDGISEELLNVLAKVPGLKVSARTSAFYFKGKEVPIPEIAKQLGVAYVVEGSVRKSGDKVRITAQLIKAVDGFHVWSDTFTRDLKDIFAVQDEIAGLIAKSLELKMGFAPAGTRQAVSPEAYQAFLVGRAAASKASMADLREAVGHFERAVALEPKFTSAWVQLASAHTRLGRWGGAPTLSAWASARAAVNRALALEPDSPDVLLALGWVLRTGEWDWRGAERAFRRALALQPNNPEILAGTAVLLFNIGQIDEAFRLARQAVQLDPLNPGTQIDLSIMFFESRKWVESERAARRALQLAPDGTSYHSVLAWPLINQGRYAEAEAEIALDTDLVQQSGAMGLLAIARGDLPKVREMLARLEGLARTQPDRADLQTCTAWLHAGLGDKDRAFAALEKAWASRDPSMAWLRVNTELAPLFSDPRWGELLRKVGLGYEQLK